MSKTAKGLVDYVRLALAQGWRYWYGTTGVRCTGDLLTRKSAQYPEHYTATRMATYRQHIAEGRMCADCINLVKGYMWLNEETGRQSYASNGCPDKSADGMFSLAKEKGSIRGLPDIPGIMVRFPGHAGVYVGNGEVIEARGFAYGVVKTKLASRPWTDWYKMPGLAYEVDDIDLPAQAGGGCPYDEPKRLLRGGCKGSDVRWVQWHLQELGYDIGGATGLDGNYGEKTTLAVRQFQNVAALKVDGIVGPLTIAALKQMVDDPNSMDCLCPYLCPLDIMQKGRRLYDGVRWLQWHLKELGYDVGPDGIDGDFGKNTEAAVIKFQIEHGIAGNGIVEKVTRDALIAECKNN